MLAVAQGKLDTVEITIDSRTAATVMLVSGGYLQAYSKGKEISGLEQQTQSLIFHAGTAINDQKVVTSGGRVMAITSFGEDHNEALKSPTASLTKFIFGE